MMSCSMIHSLMGEVWLCRTNTSQPRTESRKRTKISPFAKSKSLDGVGLMPRHPATSSASSGKARPETIISFFAPGGITLFTCPAPPRPRSPRRPGEPGPPPASPGAAGEYVRSDRGAMLGRAVVVGEDRRRSDVGAFPDVGVPDVGQVRDLRPRADHGVLQLDVAAYA